MKPVSARKPLINKILSPITRVQGGEATRALLFAFNFFLIFTAYYMIKPVRESLILSMAGGAEIKSYASGIQAGVFLLLVPLYSQLASKMTGRGVLIFVYLFLASNLLVFSALGVMGFAHIGLVYFVWVGMFNLLIISQTWSLISHVYTSEQGARLFPLIAFGSTSGAVFGSAVLSATIRSIGIFSPMLMAAGLLLICCLIITIATPQNSHVTARLPKTAQTKRQKLFGGFGLVFSNRYLTFVAFLVLISNFVNTNSEYMLGKLVANWAMQIAESSQDNVTTEILIGEFYSEFFIWVNSLVLFTQLFVVSRVVKHLGIKFGLLVLPILSLLNYTVILVIPVLSLIRILKIAENATDYSINNTVREILFLPISAEEKYKAKFAIDTHFWRFGDMCSSVAVFIIATTLGLGITAFAGLNLILVVVWFFIVLAIAKHRKLLQPTTDENPRDS